MIWVRAWPMRSAPRRRAPPSWSAATFPASPPSDIASAFRALGAADAVFGPARDGGYWLVGVRDRGLLRGLFRNVRWSTNHALADTIANLPAGRDHALVDMLEDVDDAQSWRRWRDRIGCP